MAANTLKNSILSFKDALVNESSHAMKRILLIDNQAHVLRVMKLSLGRMGFDVDTALSANVALRLLRESRYDAVIVDNSLTDVDGQDFIDTIVDEFKDMAPVLFLVTEQDTQSLFEWSSSIERTECLEKPISLHYIAGRLNELFGTYERTHVS